MLSRRLTRFIFNVTTTTHFVANFRNRLNRDTPTSLAPVYIQYDKYVTEKGKATAI